MLTCLLKFAYGSTFFALGSVAVVQAADFSQLQAHWNLNEGRDWHNMAYPFNQPVSSAADSVGDNPLTLRGGLDPVHAWVAGRQFSGIRFDAPGQLLAPARPLSELKKTATLSYWIKTEVRGGADVASSPAVAGDTSGLVWGALSASGKWIVASGKEVVAQTTTPVNDGRWHHIVITRDAGSGQVSLFLDGKMDGQGKGPAGELPGEYVGLGGARGSAGFQGVLDEVHLFAGVVTPDTVQVLYDNHAPKAYEVATLITRNQPSVTASILHSYAFDPDQDALAVSRFGQGKHGRVVYNGDGTFTYTADTGFTGTDRFPVTLTDGRGGFATTDMVVNDETTVPKMAVTKYTDFQSLPAITGGNTRENRRTPQAFDWDGDGRPDLLVGGNGQVWVYRNTGIARKPGFAAPVAVKDSTGKPIAARAIALLPIAGQKQSALVVRTGDGTLQVYQAQSTSRQNGTVFAASGTLQDDTGAVLKIPTDAFAFGDFDNDGLPDLLVGSGSAGISFYKNTGTTAAPKFQVTGEPVIGGSYNLYPYFADLNGDGRLDFLHGINWGAIRYWLNGGGRTILEGANDGTLLFADSQGREPTLGGGNALRQMDGTTGTFGDFNGDGILDVALGGHNGHLCVAYGTDVNTPRGNLQRIEAIYRAHSKDLGNAFEANNQELLKQYRQLNREWVAWAVAQPSVAGRRQAYQDLKAHIRKFDFLRRQKLDAWIKRDKQRQVVEVGPMHHVPGIVVQNWITLHNLQPDSAAHRLDVADTLGLRGLDREQYLRSGLAVADNNKCSDGQMQAIIDFQTYHPRVMFPDDHISIDQNMGDGREAMSYVFRSNKNTFGNDVGGAACESARDLREAAEKYLGKGAATGDYFTLVMAHEVCHSLDHYVRTRANKEYDRRWADMVIFAANNGGVNEVLVQDDTGWYDLKATQARFKEKGLWDGKVPWQEAWAAYWKDCPYKGLTFMRGGIDWFLGAKQETLATQANHHWPGSEARLVGAIDRYNRGYKANINEVVLFIDFLSGGLNKVPMYHVTAQKDPNRAIFNVEKAWLERNDRGHITRITIGPRVYSFDVAENGRVTGIAAHPFEAAMRAAQ